MPKKIKKVKKPEKRNNVLSYSEFAIIMDGLTEEEIEKVSGWLLDPPRTP